MQANLCTRHVPKCEPKASVAALPARLAPTPFKLRTPGQACRTWHSNRFQAKSMIGPNEALDYVAVSHSQSLPVFSVLASGAVLLSGVAAWRFAVYGRLQYITAAMLGRWVPKGKARVIQIGGGSRDLYYYPKDTILVTVIAPKLNKGMMGQAGVQAGVPVEVRQEIPSNLAFQANSSVEAVVCLQSLHTITDLPRFLAEVQRVLMPGCPFIFLQPVKGDGLAAATQLLLGGAGSALEMASFDQLKQMSAFSEVNWDVALNSQNPHIVGVAVKQQQSSDAIGLERRSKQRRKKTSGSGFAAP